MGAKAHRRNVKEKKQVSHEAGCPKQEKLKKTHALFYICTLIYRLMLYLTDWRTRVDHVSGQNKILRLETLY